MLRFVNYFSAICRSGITIGVGGDKLYPFIEVHFFGPQKDLFIFHATEFLLCEHFTINGKHQISLYRALKSYTGL